MATSNGFDKAVSVRRAGILLSVLLTQTAPLVGVMRCFDGIKGVTVDFRVLGVNRVFRHIYNPVNLALVV